MKYAIDKIKGQILEQIAHAIDRDLSNAKIDFEVPPNPEMGDLAVPCFYFAKLIGRSPNQIAQEIKEAIPTGGIIKSIQNVGPYLNFFLDASVLSRMILPGVLKEKEDYGQLNISHDQIMIEYSQPNTHKEFHIGHSRNVFLGGSLINLFRFCGYKVTAVNYLGDIGSHVAKCLWALDKFHSHDELPENKGKYLGQIYTEAVQKIEANPEYKKEADEVLQKLESGDKKWMTLWQKTRKWSLDQFNYIYKLIGAEFDDVFYESEVEKPGKKVVADLLARGIAEKSQGATIIDLEKYNLKQFLLLKSDGSSLYSTKDIALAQLKFKKYKKIKESLVVVDSRQSFYFQQLFQTLKIMGFNEKLVHVPYEFVTLKEGAMASRAGNAVLFEDFYNEVVTRAISETSKRHTDWTEKKIKTTAQKIALAAIKFNMLKVGNNSVITFDIEEALSFDGYSGPYIQYTCSRINSLLKKGKNAYSGAEYAKLNQEIEKTLMLKIADFSVEVKKAIEELEPSVIAKYLFELSRIFSNFYQKVPILSAEADTKRARLALCFATGQTLKNGLKLLGIESLKEM